MQSLESKAGVSTDLAASLVNDHDWIIKLYAAKKTIEHLALLISDGTLFATQIGKIAALSGFHVVSTSGSSIPRLSEEVRI